MPTIRSPWQLLQWQNQNLDSSYDPASGQMPPGVYEAMLNPMPDSTPYVPPSQANNAGLSTVDPYATRKTDSVNPPPPTPPKPNGRDPLSLLSSGLGVDDPNARKWRDELQAQMALQKGGIVGQSDLAKAYAAGPAQLDLSPLAALTDAWTGSKFAQSYGKPQSLQERIAGTSKLTESAQNERQKLIDNLTKLSQGNATNKLLGQLYGKESTQQMSAQKQAGAVEKDLLQRADGFARMQDLFKNATDKTIPIDKRVAANGAFQSMLVQEQLRLETGARTAATVGEKREAEYASKKLNEWLQFYGNKPLDTIPEKELANAGRILGVMGKSYADQGNRAYDQLLSRALPSQENIFRNSKDQFNKSYGEILSGNPSATAPEAAGVTQSGLSAEQQKRLEVLRAKKANGTLQ